MNKIQKGGLKYGSSTDKNNCTLRVHNLRNKNDGKKTNIFPENSILHTQVILCILIAAKNHRRSMKKHRKELIK